jgi:hypothetical protein
MLLDLVSHLDLIALEIKVPIFLTISILYFNKVYIKKVKVIFEYLSIIKIIQVVLKYYQDKKIETSTS